MKHERNRLPDRRPNETVELVFNGTPYAVTVGYFLDTGRVGEVFTHGAKVGSAMDAILDDTCVLISLLLQHGVEPKSLASSMGRHGDGQVPASIVGALTDLLADIEAPQAAEARARVNLEGARNAQNPGHRPEKDSNSGAPGTHPPEKSYPQANAGSAGGES